MTLCDLIIGTFCISYLTAAKRHAGGVAVMSFAETVRRARMMLDFENILKAVFGCS